MGIQVLSRQFMSCSDQFGCQLTDELSLMTVHSSLGSPFSALVPPERLSTLVNLIPLCRQSDGTVDDADHAVGLHEISPQLTRLGVDVFREQTVRVAMRENLFEQRPRFVLSAHRGESV